MSEEHKPVGKCYTCGKLLYATLGICRECELESKLADAKTVIEELKGKFTTAGDSIGFLATDQNGKSVWVNCQNDIIEQLQAERDLAIKEVGVWSRKAGQIQADNERLREALEKIDNYDCDKGCGPECDTYMCTCRVNLMNIAWEVLKEKQKAEGVDDLMKKVDAAAKCICKEKE